MAERSGADAPLLRVTLAHCTAPGQVVEVAMSIAEGTTVQGMLLAAGINMEDKPGQQIGIWGKACVPAQVVQEGDRLEIYRPLLVDPKMARRERFAQQGSRSAGLFARNRIR